MSPMNKLLQRSELYWACTKDVSTRPKALVCCHSLAAIKSFNPSRVRDVCFLQMVCAVR